MRNAQLVTDRPHISIVAKQPGLHGDIFEVCFDGVGVAEIYVRGPGECWLTVHGNVNHLPVGFRCFADTFRDLKGVCDFLGIYVPACAQII